MFLFQVVIAGMTSSKYEKQKRAANDRVQSIRGPAAEQPDRKPLVLLEGGRRGRVIRMPKPASRMRY